MAKILLVEDDLDLLSQLVRWLSREGHKVESTSSGDDAEQMLSAYKFDIVVLDWNLPSKTGAEIIKGFRAAGGKTPIILLTGRSDVQSKKSGLDLGADDYITKPFDEEELSARIRALLRRPVGLVPEPISIGNIVLEPETKKVYVDGVLAVLGKKEYGVLELLMKHPTRCFSTKDLIESVWRMEETSDEAVYACIKQLRAKISAKSGTCIVSTVAGAGYTVSEIQSSK